jgi:hypothetical protein
LQAGAGRPGLDLQTWDNSTLAAKQTLNVAGSVNEMNDLDSVALWLIENQPVLESFYRPSAKAAKSWTAECA